MTDPAGLDTPLPGDPDAVQVLCGGLRRSADQVRAAAERMASVGAAGTVWEGPVAGGLVEHLADLHRRVAGVAAELDDAAAVLGAWQQELHERQHRMAMLRDEAAAVAGSGAAAGLEPPDGPAPAELERLRRQAAMLVEEHRASAAATAGRLRRLTGAAEPLAGLRVSSWVAEAEALLHRLDESVGAWAMAEGGSLSEAASAISGGTAVGATIGVAVGAATPDLDRAFTATVSALAATTPASHRLLAAARRARTPVPLESLPPASFATAGGRTGEARP